MNQEAYFGSKIYYCILLGIVLKRIKISRGILQLIDY